MITFLKQPTGIYPAYNDSYLEIKSDIQFDNRAEFEVSGFGGVFTIYPDSEGKYLFNLIEFIKATFNKESFRDDTPEPSGMVKDIQSNFKTLTVSMTVYSTFETDFSEKIYKFYRGVAVDNLFNKNRLLSPYTNDSYNLTFWEGYPFFIENMRIDRGKEIKVKNNETGVETPMIWYNEDAGVRSWFHKKDDTTTASFLGGNGLRTNLSVLLNGDEINKIVLKKVKPKCGIYLKWFNSHGGYSFYLFDNFYKDETKTKDLDEINTNKFDNILTSNSAISRNSTAILTTDGYADPTQVIGKEAGRVLTINATCDRNEIEILRDLIVSPCVQMYSESEPFMEGVFRDIKIDGDLKTNSKRDNNEVSFKVILPKLKTIQR